MIAGAICSVNLDTSHEAMMKHAIKRHIACTSNCMFVIFALWNTQSIVFCYKPQRLLLVISSVKQAAF